MSRSWATAALSLLMLTTAAEAGSGGAGEISNGDVQFSRLVGGFDAVPLASLTGVTTGSPDTLASVGWWYRVAGATQETPLGIPTAGLYAGGESSLDWDSLAGGAFSAHEASFVLDAGVPGAPNDGGYVVQFLTITNESAVESLSITIFHFIDLDLPPNAGDDTALQVEWGTVEVNDAPVTGGYWAEAPSRHQTGNRTALLDLLNNTAVTQLNNGGSPLAATDFGAANQWNLAIAPNASWELMVVFAVNTNLRCGAVINDGIFCDPFESQNSSFWSSHLP